VVLEPVFAPGEEGAAVTPLACPDRVLLDYQAGGPVDAPWEMA
jgi:hypothetical protein